LTEAELEEQLAAARKRIIKEEEVKKEKESRMHEEELRKARLEENAFSKFRDDRIAHFNATSSHRQQELKDQQQKAFAEALGIRDKDYKEGDAFNESIQENKRHEEIKERINNKVEYERKKLEREMEDKDGKKNGNNNNINNNRNDIKFPYNKDGNRDQKK
jgi:hypothetical protein